MARLSASIAAVAVLLAACGGGGGDASDPPPMGAEGTATSVPTTTPPPATTLPPPPSGVTRCDDAPRLYAAPEDYADMPMYFENEMPIDQVRNWATFRPGFEGIWIDRNHNGWITVAFSEEAAASRSDLAALFPGIGAVVVEVPWTRIELEALQDRVTSALRELLPSFGVGLSIAQGVVSVDVGPLTTDTLGYLEENFGGERICVDGVDPATLPEPGPQPLAGDGWRLLADEPQVGDIYRTGIAADPGALATLWDSVGLLGPLPDVDFTTEVVIWFGAVFSGSCPHIRLDDVVVDGTLVYPVIVNAEFAVLCTADANPRAYVVALQRDRLPAGPFEIQLSASDPPPETLERTVVDADLSQPGAIASPEQIRNEPFDPGPQAVQTGDIIEPGYPVPYLLDARCGVTWLGELNFYTWITSSPIPPEWESLLADDGSIVVSLVLHIEPAGSIEASAGGVTLTYRPTNDPAPNCP